MGHQAFVNHRREKQRTKNYQRWEDLREDYDLQKKTQRETRSLDIQRTGSYFDEDRGILTLRDQQEANDARMSWRPQETWEQRPQPISQPSDQYPSSTTTSSSSINTYPTSSVQQLRPQKTGMTWDEGLPPPLKVSRRSYDEEEYNPYRNTMRSQSVQLESSRQQSRTSSPLSQGRSSARPQAPHAFTAPGNMLHLEPLPSHVPGGRMAELIEQGY